MGTRPLRIVMCPPDLLALQNAMCGEPTDGTHLMQWALVAGLEERGHHLAFLGGNQPGTPFFTTDLKVPAPAPRTWSASRGFILASKASWRAQQLLDVPYLNVFSNYRLYDCSLRVFPGYDIIYERNTLFRDGIARACRRLSLPYVLHLDADEILEYDLMGRPLNGLLRWRAIGAARHNLRAADRIVVVSQALGDHLTSRWGVTPEKLLVLPNGADVRKFRPEPLLAGHARSNLGIASDPLIVFIGNFYTWHDVGILLRAFSHVQESCPQAQLVLVGDGETREAMAALAGELGIADRVHFTGLIPHDEVPSYLAAADVAVVPYPPLPVDVWLSPLKLYEALAAGTAVVATATGQVASVVQNGHNGLTVAPGDASGLVTAIVRLLQDDDLRARLGSQARADAVAKHSWAQYIERLEQLFVSVINAHRAGRQAGKTRNHP